MSITAGGSGRIAASNVTHNGPIDWATSVSSALLAAGPGAALEAWDAAYALGLAEQPEGEHTLLLPRSRRITAPAGTRVRFADRPVRLLGLWPPRTNLEWTVSQTTKDGSERTAYHRVFDNSGRPCGVRADATTLRMAGRQASPTARTSSRPRRARPNVTGCSFTVPPERLPGRSRTRHVSGSDAMTSLALT